MICPTSQFIPGDALLRKGLPGMNWRRLPTLGINRYKSKPKDPRMQIRYKLTLLAFLLCATSSLALAQETVIVQIDPTTQRFVGDESALDREKYFKIHSGNDNDPDISKFLTDYDVSVGRSFWSPFSYAKQKAGEVGVYPQPKTGPGTVREVKKGLVGTDHPQNVIRYNIDVNAAAEWAAEYYKNHVEQSGRPEFYEPINEPFVHAGDNVFKEQQPDDALMRRRMAEWFGAIGKKLHETPELANMKVIGYSSAWPSVELWDFGHWDSRMKMFMDVAGEHMDGFATHLYDGINVTGQDTRRSGSNSEAILDLIETYSYAKWGKIIPHAISEYGGIEKGYPDAYSDVKSIQSVKSINHLLFNLLDRQNDLLLSIPFITDKATWHLTAANNYQPYGATLWKPVTIGQPDPQEFDFTARIYFYKLWAGIKGDRVLARSQNPDVQTHAFLDGNVLHIALNNLADETKIARLDGVAALPEASGARMRSLRIYDQQRPQYTDETLATAPAELELIPGETKILSITLDEAVSYGNAIKTTKYYADKHLQPIAKDQPLTFKFSGVAAGSGYGVLRMSIGRKHTMSKSPKITVNGRSVQMPDNWKGYDQANREDFFGMIEVPVHHSLLAETNTVTVTFPDAGGHLASLILQLDKFDTAVDIPLGMRPYAEPTEWAVYPNPFRNQLVFKVPEAKNHVADVVLYAMDGKKVLSKSIPFSDGFMRLNTDDIKQCMYLVSVTVDGKRFSQRVVRN
ncbi:T9SS type A sorting domain-containing protein [Pontibacter sp. E15-1]|uniref:T9SS type A sorting domain-containing protein n=1 Tax=Pontibacter sp. E15-1 TaxID=2919918 RepID=UPI001F4F8E13|nr:T9SS type A sorting domain-containing protein [Pontibacter sp. E15-1]MCJ8163292.1 T9SS type A sorting domain-containing protein [Pontibacter sp. E15-1]